MGSRTEASEHILVCVSPSPSNPKVVAAAAKMAAAFQATLTAIYVKPTNYEVLSEEDRARLRQLMGLQRRRALAEIAADREYTVSATGYGNLTEYGWFDLTEEQCRELITRGVLPDYDAGRLELVAAGFDGCAPQAASASSNRTAI